MTGDKPDERLRTPMQWTATSAGFTSGKPWEAPQADTQSVNVAREDRDPNSLLSLYRRLARERNANSALKNGKLIPVESGNEAVLAYIRADSTRAVLVVVNLARTPSPNVAMPAGYQSHTPLTRTLAPRRAYTYELTKRP